MNKFDTEIIDLIHYSLIKKLTKILIPGSNKFQLKNPAVGVLTLYEYLGKSEDLKRVLNIFNECISRLRNDNRPKYLMYVNNHGFIVGNVWDDFS